MAWGQHPCLLGVRKPPPPGPAQTWPPSTKQACCRPVCTRETPAEPGTQGRGARSWDYVRSGPSAERRDTPPEGEGGSLGTNAEQANSLAGSWPKGKVGA